MTNTPFTVAALYKFTPLDDLPQLRGATACGGRGKRERVGAC